MVEVTRVLFSGEWREGGSQEVQVQGRRGGGDEKAFAVCSSNCCSSRPFALLKMKQRMRLCSQFAQPRFTKSGDGIGVFSVAITSGTV